MKYHIVTADYATEIILAETQAEKFYGQIERKSDKEGSKTLRFSIEGSTEKVLVVLSRKSQTYKSARGTSFREAGVNEETGKPEWIVVDEWTEDTPWESETGIWDKIGKVNEFTKKYPYVASITVFPELLFSKGNVPDDFSDEIIEKKRRYKTRNDRGERRHVIDGFVEIAEAIRDTYQNEQAETENRTRLEDARL